MNAVAAVLPREVIKRDGRRAPFDAVKIRSAILRAGQASGEFGEDEADLLTAQVAKVLIHRFRGTPPGIESIQDVVEQMLIAANHLQTARAYIVYRETAQEAAPGPQDGGRRRKRRSTNTSIAPGLARQRQRQPGLLPGRPDSQRLRQGGGQLLAEPRLFAGSRRSAPRGRRSTSTTSTCWRATAPAGRCAPCCTRASTACRARSRRGRPSTCPPRSARSSTSSARCRTNGPARRRSPPSTPTWRRSSARTICPIPRSSSTSRN